MTAATVSTLSGPSALSTLREVTTPLSIMLSLRSVPSLLKAPRGDGRPVILLPGYGASELSMTPLAAFLNQIGYDARQWGLGRNRGTVEEDIEAFAPRVEDHAAFAGEPVTLIGWSLGGVIARETARLQPETVREVITLATPISGGPKYTRAGPIFARRFGLDLDHLEEDVHARNMMGLTQPVTSIYTKSDGIVGWQASVDTYNAHARNIEVNATHFSIGVNPDAWRIIAETLAR